MTQARIQHVDLKTAGALADIHAKSFETGWSEDDFKIHIERDLVLGLWQDGRLAGFIILRIGGDQAEILTLAIAPIFRGQGLGAQLLKAGEERVKIKGADVVFLEVAEDNLFAIRLYKGAAYQAIGRRPAYYRRKNGRVASLNFSKNL